MDQEHIDLSRRIGGRLRDERKRHGLSLGELSARTDTGLSKSRISNYEQGIRRMGIEEAESLARALGTVSPAWLLCLDDGEPLSDQELELLRCFRNADERGRRTVLGIAGAQLPSTPN